MTNLLLAVLISFSCWPVPHVRGAAEREEEKADAVFRYPGFPDDP